MHSNGPKLRDALDEVSITTQFLGSKLAKINFSKKISVLSAVFIELMFRRLQNHLADLKNTKHLIFFLTTDFL